MPTSAMYAIWTHQVRHLLGLLVAWAWALLTIIGGVGLIITLGPLPPTNGWFALFSGLAACPATSWVLKKYGNMNFPGWARFAAALLIIMAGRLTLKIEGRLLSCLISRVEQSDRRR